MVVLGFFKLFAWLADYKLTDYAIGADGRLSNSKVQVALWSFTLFSAYLGTLAMRVSVYGWALLGGVGITTNLLALSGMSAFTYGSAKAITVGQHEGVQQDQQAAQKAADDANAIANSSAAATPGKTTAAAEATRAQALVDDAKALLATQTVAHAKFKNLFCDDYDKLDFGDSQMFFVVLLAVAVFGLTVFHFLAWIDCAPTMQLPDVDTTLLSAFGLGQGAYLVKKAATPLGKG